MPQGKCSDENVGNRAPGCLMGVTLLNMSSPCLTGVRGIFCQAGFLMVNSQLKKEFLQGIEMSGECRSQLDERHRTYQQTFRKFGIQKALGIGCKRRVIKTDIKQDAGINDPSHYCRSPSRSNSIHPEVVSGMPFWNRFMNPRAE